MDNPYQSPVNSSQTLSERRAWWTAIFWAAIGFAGGTVFTAPLILSRDPQERLNGGMMFGGIIGGSLGVWYGIRKGHS